MKIERIAPNKIKVTLSVDDLKDWDVSFESLTYNSPEAQDLFWSLIHRAELEAGFYADGSQLVVEAMPVKNDGFVMIITRVEDSEDASPQRYIKPRIKKEAKPRKRARTLSSPLVFEFSSFDDVVEACRSIENRFAGNSSLYKYHSKYYLALYITNDFVADDMDVMLTEYARKERNALVKTGELSEHGVLLVGSNAIESLNAHF